MDGYTLSISRCSGGDGVEESFKAKIKRREAALDAFAVAEAYCKESWMVSRCEREGFDGFIIDLRSDAEDETIRLVRLVPDSEDALYTNMQVETAKCTDADDRKRHHLASNEPICAYLRTLTLFSSG